MYSNGVQRFSKHISPDFAYHSDSEIHLLHMYFIYVKLIYLQFEKYHKTKLHGLSPRANHTDRATAACRRSDCQLFADRGCHVVSVTDPYGRILGFLDGAATFLSSSSSVVLTRLSGPRSRPTSSCKY
jgi:hypothetical protein